MVLGNALQSNGSSSTCPFTSVTLGANTTIAMWIYFTGSITNYNCLWGNDIWYHGSGGAPTGKLRFTHSASGICLNTTTSVFNDAAWHFYVVTDNGSAVKAYCDLVDMGNSAAYRTMSGCVSTKLLQGVNANNFIGKLDEVCVWNRVLNSTELALLYNGGVGLKGDITKPPWNSGLLLGWHMDETASPLTDFSGLGHTATPTNVSFVPGRVSG